MMNKGAIFSPCRKYRYTLTRIWTDKKPFALFVCLNPSTADENKDDPTIRRCIRFAESWGYGGLVMCNLFAYRSTDPKALYQIDHKVGPMVENWNYVKVQSQEAGVTVAAWGVHGTLKDAGGYALKELLSNPHYLALTKGGHPKHPLYLKKHYGRGRIKMEGSGRSSPDSKANTTA
jgi:hypothetical protein